MHIARRFRGEPPPLHIARTVRDKPCMHIARRFRGEPTPLHIARTFRDEPCTSHWLGTENFHVHFDLGGVSPQGFSRPNRLRPPFAPLELPELRPPLCLKSAGSVSLEPCGGGRGGAGGLSGTKSKVSRHTRAFHARGKTPVAFLAGGQVGRGPWRHRLRQSGPGARLTKSVLRRGEVD